MDHIPSVGEVLAVIPKIEALEFIGSGGFKAVYKAEIGEQTEALKLVLLPPNDDSGTREGLIARVEREIDVLSRADTPFLVKLGRIALEQVTIGDHEYLLYSEELLPGHSVIDVIKGGVSPTVEEVLGLAKCLMGALAEISNLGHIHRDVKPHNVMATGLPERPFVLLDLGIAFKIDGTQLTAPGSGPPGTFSYMAPELFQPNYKDFMDVRSDIYSAGVTIFEFAAGTHPLMRPGDNYYVALSRVMDPTPSKLETHRNDLPSEFCSMVDRCIKKTPALRFHTPQAFLDELERAS
jgi:serine/threonine protein kinase